MSRLTNRQRYNSVKMLKQLPSNQLSTMRKSNNLNLSVDGRMEEYQKEIKQLRVRVSKIDQIQKYVNILVLQNEQLKQEISDLQRNNSELTRQANNIKRQNSFGQELNNQRQKSVQEDIRNHVKLLQQQYEQDKIKHLKKIESLMNENNELMKLANEKENTIKILKQQDEKLANQLRKYILIANQTKQEAQKKTQMICRLENDSSKTIQTMKNQIKTLCYEVQNLQSQNTKFQRISNQLKQDGAIMMTERTGMKQRLSELEELRVSNTKQIERLTNEICITNEKNIFLSTQLEESQQRHKHLIAALEKDNITLRAQLNILHEDVATKQIQIRDLLVIITQLQKTEKEATETATHLKEANLRVNRKLRDVEGAWQRQKIQLEEMKIRCSERSKYASETEHNYVQLKTKLVQMELIYQKQNQRVKELDHLLEEQISKRKSLQSQKQQLLCKDAERQQLLRQSQKCIDQCQKVYIIQKDSHATSKRKIKQLEGSLQFLTEEKNNFVSEGLEKMESIMSEKYENILKEKSDHFKNKIQYLQSQIALLQQPQSYHSLQ